MTNITEGYIGGVLKNTFNTNKGRMERAKNCEDSLSYYQGKLSQAIRTLKELEQLKPDVVKTNNTIAIKQIEKTIEELKIWERLYRNCVNRKSKT